MDDAAMQHFVMHGFVLLPLDELTPSFHAELYEKCERRWDETGGRNGAPPGPKSTYQPWCFA